MDKVRQCGGSRGRRAKAKRAKDVAHIVLQAWQEVAPQVFLRTKLIGSE